MPFLSQTNRRNPPTRVSKSFNDNEKGQISGESLIAGTGAFLKEDANSNDYLGEYTGEYISEEETERRGKIYELSVSYILGQGSIDATRAGNVFRFVNHSTTPNCRVVIRIVHGKPIAGFYAKKKIEAGTELTFDYDYNDHHVIKYFQSKPKDRVPKMKKIMKSPSSSPPPPPPRKRRKKNDPKDDDPNEPSTSSRAVSYR
ncbi:hypothetical protein CAEBREN_29762 [Caenorhabditis brenneri]|uniref:SET domain-containing protein n=1 Tax=Caenorhabditis brenneri TaxID=135651 RepID=G0NIP3_CAEBE|nr:hypothetical protein CAEBREN_29762 [Caenorhabditis brenneri]